MPARDGTGPLGQGSRTGRGLGNCRPSRSAAVQPPAEGTTRLIGWGGRFLGSTLGRLFRRRGANRINRR